MCKKYENKLRRQRRTMTKLRRENTSLRVRLGIAKAAAPQNGPARFKPVGMETR